MGESGVRGGVKSETNVIDRNGQLNGSSQTRLARRTWMVEVLEV